MIAEFYDVYTSTIIPSSDREAITQLRIRTALRKSRFEFDHPQARKYPDELQAALDFLRNVGHALTRADDAVVPRAR